MLLVTEVRLKRASWTLGDLFRDRLAVLATDAESGQVGSMVLIAILVIIAIVAGMLIFNAVKNTAKKTANCISNPNSSQCATP